MQGLQWRPRRALSRCGLAISARTQVIDLPRGAGLQLRQVATGDRQVEDTVVDPIEVDTNGLRRRITAGLIGLGMATPNNISIPYTVLDGARYLRTTKPPRTISLPGRFQADTLFDLATNQSAMRAALDRDLIPVQQPLILQIEPVESCDI